MTWPKQPLLVEPSRRPLLAERELCPARALAVGAGSAYLADRGPR